MKKIIVLAALFFLTGEAQAQQKNKNGYYLLPQLALLNGDNHANGQVMVSYGARKKNIAFGVGIAMDYYKMRTVPVFAEIRSVIGKNKNVFIYVDAGPNFMWPLESQYSSHWLLNGTTSRDEYKTGIYGDAGLGYIFPVANKKEILLSFGYSFKTVRQVYSETVMKEFPPYELEMRYRELDYALNRLALRVGIKL